uniref:Ammonium transporter AmtB-like domain-containing protein n=1 Tax=Acrobeloides nanus TaxID=290746 RepID=A0A914DGC2_9BILA
MVKNAIDVVFGGLTYWMLGFGFSFGDYYPNSLVGIGKFFYDYDSVYESTEKSWTYSALLFQISYSTTTSTIVSASMAERIRLKPYIVITSTITMLHSVAAHWVWSEQGFLHKLGVVDAAGCAVAHLVGGVAGLAVTLYLKPRPTRFGPNGSKKMSSPTKALLGTFMIWWSWLGFNTGSTYGVAAGRWRLVAKSATVTFLSSVGGGCAAILISLFSTNKCQIDLLIDGLLASLVSTAACCQCIRPIESVFIGAVGATLALASYPLLEKLKIDDPVGVIPVHIVGSIWGMIAVGIFGREDPHGFKLTSGLNGLIHGGGFYLLGIQILCVICIFIWTFPMTYLTLKVLDHWKSKNHFTGDLRMSRYEEQLGADLVEHCLEGKSVPQYNIEKKMNARTVSIVIKCVARWKRKTKVSREARLKLELEQAIRNRNLANYSTSRPLIISDSQISTYQHGNMASSVPKLNLKTRKYAIATRLVSINKGSCL